MKPFDYVLYGLMVFAWFVALIVAVATLGSHIGYKPRSSTLVFLPTLASAVFFGARTVKKRGAALGVGDVWAFALVATIVATTVLAGFSILLAGLAGSFDWRALALRLQERPLAVGVDFLVTLVLPIAIANAFFFPLGARTQLKRQTRP